MTFWEEIPYFRAEDSPFYGGMRAGTIYLEDIENHELNIRPISPGTERSVSRA